MPRRATGQGPRARADEGHLLVVREPLPRAAADAVVSRTLSLRVRIPSPRSRGQRLAAGSSALSEERFKNEIVAPARAPWPKAKSITIDKTPVAKPAKGEEYHFDECRNRVAFSIDLDRLMSLVKADAAAPDSPVG